MEQIAWTFALAGFAGLVNYLQRFAGNPADRPPWEWRVAGIKVVIGAFVGLLTLWLVRKHIENLDYVYFAIAIAGYGGPLTLDAFWNASREVVVSLATRAAQGSKDDPPKG